MRRVGVLVGLAKDDPETEARFTKFRQECQRLGWFEGRNISVAYRFAPAGAEVRDRVEELIALEPDVILAHTTPVTTALRRKTRTIPIVFVNVSDPVGAGLVDTIGRPGGNVTGLLQYEEGIFGKWLQMLQEIASRITRVALMGNPELPGYDYLFCEAKSSTWSWTCDARPRPMASIWLLNWMKRREISSWSRRGLRTASARWCPIA
jgi:putative ABC transport system substrate-binding protein